MNDEATATLVAENARLRRELEDARRSLWLVLMVADDCTVRIPIAMLKEYDRNTCAITGDTDAVTQAVRLSAVSLVPPNVGN